MGQIPMTRIAKLREKKGLTQSQLAQLLGVDVSTVRNLEQNRSGIKAILRVVDLCEALDCEPKELIEYVDVEDLVEQ